MSLTLSSGHLDVGKPAPAPAAAAAQSFNSGLLDAAFTSAPVTNNSAPAQGFQQDKFDEAFGAPDSSPFGVPPVTMVYRVAR